MSAGDRSWSCGRLGSAGGAMAVIAGLIMVPSITSIVGIVWYEVFCS